MKRSKVNAAQVLFLFLSLSYWVMLSAGCAARPQEVHTPAVGPQQQWKERSFWSLDEMVIYQPSLKSLKIGIEAGPFFGNTQLNGRIVAADTLTQAFGALPALSQDRIAINLRLIDATNGKSINWTTIEGSPSGSGSEKHEMKEKSVAKKVIAEKSIAEKPMRDKPVIEKPTAGKFLPRKEVPHGEEWGQ